jgi:hypothetical protein
MIAWLLWIGVVGFAINAGALRLQKKINQRMGVTEMQAGSTA